MGNITRGNSFLKVRTGVSATSTNGPEASDAKVEHRARALVLVALAWWAIAGSLIVSTATKGLGLGFSVAGFGVYAGAIAASGILLAAGVLEKNTRLVVLGTFGLMFFAVWMLGYTAWPNA